MLKTLQNILKTGDATVKYPFAPLQTPPDMRGKPEHDTKRCIACGACAVACPPNALKMRSTTPKSITWSINYGRCIFCGRCEEVCPVQAIQLGSEFELAVMGKDDLEECSSYTLEACSECGRPFAPRKELDYARRLLVSMTASDEVEDALSLIGVCPACKRRRDALLAKRTDDVQGGLL